MRWAGVVSDAPTIPTAHATFAGRPHVEDQGPSPDGFSQILILPPTRALAFRLVLTRDAAHRWAASEIRFDDVEGAGGEP